MESSEQCESSSSGDSARVKINVGGTIFETTLTTLNKIPTSMLATMVSKRWRQDKELFIDRDPTHFPKILNYLRDGDEFQPPVECHAELRCEAMFYNLPGLVQLCSDRPLETGDTVQWKVEAVPLYWRAFVRYSVDDSLSLPFIYDRNNHTYARCFACEEFQDPKCSYLFDINYTDWQPISHHMLFMKGEITQLMGDVCCIVAWDNGQQIHLPRSALRRAVP